MSTAEKAEANRLYTKSANHQLDAAEDARMTRLTLAHGGPPATQCGPVRGFLNLPFLEQRGSRI